MSFPFLYQLQGASRDSLARRDFEVGVVDMDDTGMTRGEVGDLESVGKTLFTYLSIGEAEEYRNYWSGIADENFVLGENPDWDGNHRVAFWNPTWQEIMLARVSEAVEKGYSGMYLDIVDGYQVDEVRAAYDGDDIRQEMVDFVVLLSKHAKSMDPDFMVIPQNAVELLAAEGDAGAPNTAYLDAIDGVGVEDLFYDDNTVADWTRWDLEYIRHAQEAGKFVLATSYPTDGTKQADFVQKAQGEGLIPFVGNRALDGTVDPVNETIDLTLPAALDGAATGSTDEESSTGGDEAAGGEDGETADQPPEDTTGGTGGDAPEQDTTDEPSDGGAEGNTDEPATGIGDDEADPVYQTPEMPAGPNFSGHNVLSGRDRSETLRGEALDGGGGDDTLIGTRDSDVLAGGAGLDTLYGRGGDDSLHGQAGHDELRGGGGDDRIAGGDGHDELFGGVGNDLLVGGRGYDVLRGGRGDDRLVADGLDPVIDGGEGFDTLAPDIAGFMLERGDLIGIEEVDLRGDAATSLEIDADAIPDITDGGRLFVRGDAGDTVTTWFGRPEGIQEIAGVGYAVLSSDKGELFVQVGLVLNGDPIVIA